MNFVVTEEKKKGAISVRIAPRRIGWTVYVVVHTETRWALLTNQCMSMHGVRREEFSNLKDAKHRVEEVKQIVAKNWLGTARPLIQDWWWHGQQYARIYL